MAARFVNSNSKISFSAILRLQKRSVFSRNYNTNEEHCFTIPSTTMQAFAARATRATLALRESPRSVVAD
jgi:hypothetical protein